MKTDFFFVYGTLKENGHFAKDFDKFRISSEEATINNMNLYKLGWFPGIVPGNGNVKGELHKYKNPDTVIKLMDRIEGYDGTKHSLFKRERQTVVTSLGKEENAYIYVFNQMKAHGKTRARLIKTGIWVINQ